jgi:hypothetical protein
MVFVSAQSALTNHFTATLASTTQIKSGARGARR